MKKLLLALVICAVACSVAYAGPALRKNCGCGLGSMLFETNDGLMSQTAAATNNGLFGNQTFGISSGTSGCTNDGKVMVKQKTTMFAQLNFENLSQEMAQGQGEHLASLATLMGVPTEDHAAFFTMTQERYTSLVKTGETSGLFYSDLAPVKLLAGYWKLACLWALEQCQK